jgi:ABC-type Co2+ transport system permease subunit
MKTKVSKSGKSLNIGLATLGAGMIGLIVGATILSAEAIIYSVYAMLVGLSATLCAMAK